MAGEAGINYFVLYDDILNEAELTCHNPDKFYQQLWGLLHIDSVHRGWCNVMSWHSLGHLETKEVWVRCTRCSIADNKQGKIPLHVQLVSLCCVTVW